MDRKLSKPEEIQRLIQLAAASRSCLGKEVAALKYKLDVPARMRDSLKRHPTGWLLGSLASGLLASLFFRRPLFRRPKTVVTEEKKHRSFPIAILGLTLTAIRPFAKIWLTDQVKNYLAGQSPFAGTSRPGRHESHSQ